MRRCLLLGSLLGALLTTGACVAQPEAPYFFLQMADPQFGMFSDNAGFEEETIRYEKAIAIANQLQPAFVVVCGDLVNTPGDSAQHAELDRISARLDERIPLYLVSGNHDVGNAPSPESLLRYRETTGDDYYTFRHARTLGIVLNSSIISQPAGAPGEYDGQLAWLRQQLAEGRASGPARIFVFQHHSFFLTDPDEPDEYFNIPTERRRVFLDLLKSNGVRTVFAGHYHRNSGGTDDGLEMVTTGPVGKPLGDDPSGLRVVKVFSDRIEHRYYGLDDVPSSITLDAVAPE